MPNPKLETLIDAFDTNNFSSNWVSFVFGGATLQLNNKRVEITYPAASTSITDGDISSVHSYDLTESYAFFQVQTVPNPGTNADAELRICTTGITFDNFFRWVYEAGTLYAQYMKAGNKVTVNSFAYDSGLHRWWKISEHNGVITWATSPDGKTYTTQGTFTHGMVITSSQILLAGICFQNETSPGAFYFDNCNIVPVPTPATLPTPDTRISYTPKSKYAFLLYLNGTFFADITGIAQERKTVKTRNESDQIDFVASMDKINTLCNTLGLDMFDLFQAAATEVRVVRYGTVYSAGELGPWNGRVGSDRVLKFQAKGWYDLMKARRVTGDYSGQSALTIIQSIFNATLARTFGNAGNFSGLVIGNVPSVDNTTVYPEQQYDDKTLYDAMYEMTNEPNGPDIEFTWDKRLNIYHPAQGVTRDDIIFTYPFGNVKDIEFSVDPTRIVNSLVGKGKGSVGDQITSPLGDAVSAQKYGLREDTADFPNITDQTQLDNLTQSHLNVYKTPVIINKIMFDGSGVVSAPVVGSFNVGDQVRIFLKNASPYKDLTKFYTIDQIEVFIGENDEEDVTLSVSDSNLAKNG